MNSLFIPPTEQTPGVHLSKSDNVFKIDGKSVPEQAEEFYAPVLSWFDEYINQPNEETVLEINLEFFNISSSKRLLFLLYKLNELHTASKLVRVKWMYNESDEDMFEVGQDYAYMVKIPFEFVSYDRSSVRVAV